MKVLSFALLISLILLSEGCVSLPSSKFNLRKDDLLGFTETEISIDFGGYENHYAIIPVSIQGVTLKLMFDSGSEWGTITLIPEVLDKIKVNYTANKMQYRDAYGNVYYTRKFTIPEIRIGDLNITNIIAVENLTSPEGFDGYIGLGFLKNFNMMIDYQNKRITLYRNTIIPDFLEAEKWFRYRYYENQQFKINFNFLNKEYQIGLDSGSGTTAIPVGSELGKDILSHLGITEENVVINQRTGENVYIYNIEHIYLDEYDLGKQVCVLSDDMSGYMGNGLMGFDFFNNNIIFICFESKDIWLKRVN